MNGPLHQFLANQISPELLCQASLVVDNARSQVQPRFRPVVPDYFSIHSRSTVSLHSLPSLTSDSGVSRWDSCIKQTADCLSPPQRRPRRVGEEVRVDSSPSKPHKQKTPKQTLDSSN